MNIVICLLITYLKIVLNYVFYCLMLTHFIVTPSAAKQNKVSKEPVLNEYPSLIYKAKQIAVTRDLFASEYSYLTKVELESKSPEFIVAEPKVDCQYWSSALTYYGTFSAGQEESIMVKNSESNVIKVRVGELFKTQEKDFKTLRLIAIKQNSFTADYAGMSICSFNKLTY